jgi:addiction module RelE/StbE family toxin
MFQNYKINILPVASSDLLEIFEFIERDSPKNAASLIQRLFNAIDSLEQLPHRCKLHRSTKNAGPTIRSMTVSPYIIYYRILESENILEILTVRHGARKQPTDFPK